MVAIIQSRIARIEFVTCFDLRIGPMELKHIFITVGTTKFKKLIDKLQEKSLVDVSFSSK